MGKFAVSIKCPNTKSASSSGGFAPLTLVIQSLPQTPVIGLCYSTYHGAMPPISQMLRARTVEPDLRGQGRPPLPDWMHLKTGENFAYFWIKISKIFEGGAEPPSQTPLPTLPPITNFCICH